MISSVIFACAVVMLITHAQTHLTVAFIGAVVAIVIQNKITVILSMNIDSTADITINTINSGIGL